MKSLLLLFFLVQTSCGLLDKPLKEPKVKVGEITVEDFSLSKTTLGFLLSVDNPNTMSFDVTSLDYQITVGGKNITATEEKINKKIEAEKVTEVMIPITLSNKEVFGALKQLANLKNTPYKLSGTIKIGVLLIPFEDEGELKPSEWVLGE